MSQKANKFLSLWSLLSKSYASALSIFPNICHVCLVCLLSDRHKSRPAATAHTTFTLILISSVDAFCVVKVISEEEKINIFFRFDIFFGSCLDVYTIFEASSVFVFPTKRRYGVSKPLTAPRQFSQLHPRLRLGIKWKEADGPCSWEGKYILTHYFHIITKYNANITITL